MAGGLVVRCTTEPREILPLDRVRSVCSARPAATGRPARLPRHRDDRARDGHRDRRLPRRPRLVGGRRLPPGPVAAPRPCRRAGAPHRIGRLHPADGWLVTYNGRGFDWPLLVTRYRMARRDRADPRRPPRPAAVRPARLPPPAEDARLRTVETGLLGTVRHGDIDGWEIPGRYLGFLRGGPAEPLADGRPPQRRGRPLARAPPRPARQRLRDAGSATDRAGRRPRSAWPARTLGRDGSTRRWSATTSPSRPSQRRRQAPAPRPIPLRPLRRATTGPNPPARSRGGRRACRRTSAARHGRPRVRAVGPLGGLRHSLDDRADRRRARPICCAACGRCDDAARRLGEPGGRSGPDRDRRLRSSSPSSASTGCATRSGRCGATGDGLALAERRRRLGRPEPRLEARPARPRATAATPSRRAGPRPSARRARPAAAAGRGPALTSAPGPGRAPDRTSRPSSAGRRPAR